MALAAALQPSAASHRDVISAASALRRAVGADGFNRLN